METHTVHLISKTRNCKDLTSLSRLHKLVDTHCEQDPTVQFSRSLLECSSRTCLDMMGSGSNSVHLHCLHRSYVCVYSMPQSLCLFDYAVQSNYINLIHFQSHRCVRTRLVVAGPAQLPETLVVFIRNEITAQTATTVITHVILSGSRSGTTISTTGSQLRRRFHLVRLTAGKSTPAQAARNDDAENPKDVRVQGSRSSAVLSAPEGRSRLHMQKNKVRAVYPPNTLCALKILPGPLPTLGKSLMHLTLAWNAMHSACFPVLTLVRVKRQHVSLRSSSAASGTLCQMIKICLITVDCIRFVRTKTHTQKLSMHAVASN